MNIALVLFTVLSQFAVGTFVTLWFIDTQGNRVSMATGRFLAFAVVGITGVSLLSTLFHLGQPLQSFMAIRNLGTSWLSREIAVFSLFLLLALIYCLQWKEQASGQRKWIGGLGALAGVAGVVISGCVYTLPAMPAWNNFLPVFSFLMTATILGPLFVSTVFLWKKEVDTPDMSVWTLAALVTSAVSYCIYLTTNSGGLLEQQMTASQILSSGAFWIRIVSGWLLPICLLGYFKYKRQELSFQAMGATFLLVLIGELVARELFYSTIVGFQIGL